MLSLPLTNNDMDWSKILSVYGVPAVVALFLVWFMTTKVDSSLSRIEQFQQSHSIDMQYSIKANEDLKSQMYITNRILQQICANQARTEEQRNRCFQ